LLRRFVLCFVGWLCRGGSWWGWEIALGYFFAGGGRGGLVWQGGWGVLGVGGVGFVVFCGGGLLGGGEGLWLGGGD